MDSTASEDIVLQRFYCHWEMLKIRLQYFYNYTTQRQNIHYLSVVPHDRFGDC